MKSETAHPFAKYLQAEDRPVLLYPRIYEILGSRGAELLLMHLGYWSDKCADPEGWIYKTQKEITAETTLSRWETVQARAILVHKGFLKERLGMVPARMLFQIQRDAVVQMLALQQSSLPKISKLRRKRITSSDASGQQTITKSSQEITHENTTERDTDDKKIVSRTSNKKMESCADIAKKI